MKRRIAAFVVLGFLFYHAPALAEPQLHEYDDYYDIQGQSAEQLRAQMNALRPMEQGGKFDADTQWEVKWRFDYREKNQTCELTRSQVSVDITYHLPRWTNEDQADSPLQSRWENYMKHLRLHESGHAQNGEKAAAEIADMLKNFAPFSTCAELEEMADERAQQIIAEHNAWDREYDRETHHGKTQGAVFP